MAHFKLSKAKIQSRILERIASHQKSVEELFSEHYKHVKPNSVFIFDGSKWTCRDLDSIEEKKSRAFHKKFGQPGQTGPEGKEGREGQPGQMGSTGPEGKEGREGQPGQMGSTGPEGREGQPGQTGPEGKEGREGQPGSTGPEGREGQPGQMGSTGPEGREGQPGQMGPTGPCGMSLTFLSINDETHNTIFGVNAGTGSMMNTFIGYMAGNKESSSENTYIGHLAGSESISTGKNTFIGNEAGRYSIGAQNTYIGDGVCSINKSGGSYNTFLGAEAGLNNTIGFGNTFLGVVAGVSNIEGNWNIFIGQAAGHSNTKGTNNIFIGTNSGNSNVSGNSCICIGDESDVSSEEAINQIVIGQGVIGSGNNTITFPDNLVSFSSGTEVNFSSSNGGCLYPISSSQRWKTDIRNINIDIDTSKIYNLRPVTFTPTKNHENISKRDLGLIAEEVVTHFPMIVPKDNTDQPASIKYSLLPVLMLPEIKKLKERVDCLENLLK